MFCFWYTCIMLNDMNLGSLIPKIHDEDLASLAYCDLFKPEDFGFVCFISRSVKCVCCDTHLFRSIVLAQQKLHIA